MGCVEQERCERNDNSKAINTTEIDMRGAIFNLDEDMEAANNAECSKQGDICCPGKFVQPPPLECPSKTGENIKCVDRLIDLLSDHNHQIMDETKIKRTKTLEGFLRKACELAEDFSLLEIHNFLGKLSTNANSDSSAIRQKDRDVPCCESEFCRKLNGRYFYFEKKTLSYEDAKQNCISKGEGTKFTGRLFEPQTAIENDYVAEAAAAYLPANPDFWIGIRTEPTKRKFKFESGREIFDNWSRGEPSDSFDGEDCVDIQKLRNWDWNDMKCSQKWGSICEFVTE